MEFKEYSTNATTRHFEKLTKYLYIITATNFWFEDVKLPRVFVKTYNTVSKFIEATLILFVISEILTLYSQDNLTEKQKTDVIIKSVSNFIAYTIYGFTVYQKNNIRKLLFSLTVTLKELYNDEAVERTMIRKTRMYLAGLVLVGFGVILSYGMEGAVRSLMSNDTFTTIITIWPDMEDRRPVASFARILIYISWLLMAAHIMSIYSIIISISICLGCQFANLKEYFLSLNDIFDGEGHDQEIRYEKAVKVGIKMHNITLRCVAQLQASCGVAYSGQVLIIVSVMLLLMIQLMQTERSLVAIAPIVFMGTGVLVSSGLFIWSAGDITFEAERLPVAMFHSGWHNCTRQSSVRVRKMITIAMTQAQQIVVIKGLYIIDLSYESYVAIVKSSYSVFSVIY